MKIESIKFQIDSGISIFCEKSGGKETYTLSPEHIRYVVVDYDVSLIDSPLQHVTEQYKLNQRNIEFQQDNFVLFFPLDNIIKPNESQITLRSIIFFLEDGKKFVFCINKTYTFIELQKNNLGKEIHAPSRGTLLTKAKRKSLQKGDTSSQTSPSGNVTSPLPIRDDATSLFVDSFQKFKDNLENPELLDLFNTKEKALNFNLKNFGISLLCKLLLLIKYLNNLVDNEFQADLHQFIKSNLLSEVRT
ncbi:MAG: hypothetical protein ACFFDC_01035 [Promethearchaeota archaeon]